MYTGQYHRYHFTFVGGIIDYISFGSVMAGMTFMYVGVEGLLCPEYRSLGC